MLMAAAKFEPPLLAEAPLHLDPLRRSQRVTDARPVFEPGQPACSALHAGVHTVVGPSRHEEHSRVQDLVWVRARFTACIAASSAGGRLRASAECRSRSHAVLRAIDAATERVTARSSTASSTVVSSGGGPSTLTWRLPSPMWPEQDDAGTGCDPLDPVADSRLELHQSVERQRDVELVRDPRGVDRLGVALAVLPEP